MAQDSQGRLVAALGRYADFRVGRFLSDGSLDHTFGMGNGYVSTELGASAYANALALQPDGKILAAGSDIPGALVLARYREDGSPDRSFGNQGHVFAFGGWRGGGALDIALASNGRILLAGYGIDYSNRWRALVVAYRPDGKLDKRFGKGGVSEITTDGELEIKATSILALPNGKVLLAGDLGGRVMLARLDSDGRFDKTFSGGDGYFIADLTPKRRCLCTHSAALGRDRNGRILLAANVAGPDPEPTVLLRFKPNGFLDRSFGDRGVARATLGTRLATKDMAIQPNGKILLAGTYNVPRSGEARVAAVRFSPNGHLDRSFGRHGFFTRDFGVEGVAYAAVTQADGKVVIAGRVNKNFSPTTENESVYDTAEVFLARFLP